jgi:hypothetical protein
MLMQRSTLPGSLLCKHICYLAQVTFWYLNLLNWVQHLSANLIFNIVLVAKGPTGHITVDIWQRNKSNSKQFYIDFNAVGNRPMGLYFLDVRPSQA